MDTKPGKIYSTQWSRFVWAMTSLIFVMLAIAMVLAIILAHWVPLIVAVVFGIFIAGSFSFAPRNYMLSESAIIVNRPVFKLKIPFESIVQMRQVDKKDLGSVIRVMGMGGVFGFWGQFQSSTIGPFKCYMTNNDKMVQLENRAGEKIILSPSNPNDFIETVKQLIHRR